MFCSTDDITWDTDALGQPTTVTINYETEWSGHRIDEPVYSVLSIEIYGIEIGVDKLPAAVVDRALQEIQEYEHSRAVDDAMAGYEARRDEDLIN